jgi:hypothetical protein
MYGAYKTKDDADFNTFVTQPFLTSEESDKLINQLRDSGFFDKMEYSAQNGDWSILGSLTEIENEKNQKKKRDVNLTQGNVSNVKGKNLGLGSSVGDVAAGVAMASDAAGVTRNAASKVAKVKVASKVSSKVSSKGTSTTPAAKQESITTMTSKGGFLSMLFTSKKTKQLERRIAKLEQRSHSFSCQSLT